jgi:hypothetical protein
MQPSARRLLTIMQMMCTYMEDHPLLFMYSFHVVAGLPYPMCCSIPHMPTRAPPPFRVSVTYGNLAPPIAPSPSVACVRCGRFPQTM